MAKENEKVTKTNSQRIWDEIKGKKLDMFSLPDQTVSMYCSPVYIDPDTLHITLKASSVLSQLEESLGSKYKFAIEGKYVSVKRA